jgi:hypothetical protein
MFDMPLLPELVAVIVADPAAIPVTMPLKSTVAAAALFVDHAVGWPDMTFPFWSFTIACSETVAPATIDAEAGATVTVVTTGVGGGAAVTVMLDVPTLPELVAEIVAEPAATPVTTPLELTVAAAALFVDHAMAWPDMTFPFWSFTVACSETVPPATIDADGGATVTVVTTGVGGGAAVTVMLDVPILSELVAEIVAEPAANPVTTPLELTVAAAALLVDQAMAWPDMTFPFWSVTVAWSETVAPAAMDAEGGATVTFVTTALGGGGAGGAVVEAATTLERPPYTAFSFIVPRNAISWKL